MLLSILARNAVLGKTASAMTGGNFANGAVTGSFSYTLPAPVLGYPRG